MIQFRCWYCNKRYSMPEDRVRQRFECSTCNNTLRVPRHDNGSCRVKTPLDWLIESVLYGGGGALLGLGLAFLLVSQVRFTVYYRGWLLLGALPVIGFLAGVFGGERAIVWLGEMIRDRERR